MQKKPIKQSINDIRAHADRIQNSLKIINQVTDKACEVTQSSAWEWLKGLKV